MFSLLVQGSWATDHGKMAERGSVQEKRQSTPTVTPFELQSCPSHIICTSSDVELHTTKVHKVLAVLCFAEARLEHTYAEASA